MAFLVKMVGMQASIACFYYLRCSGGEPGWGVILSLDSSFIPVLTWCPFSSLPDPAGSIETGSDQSEKAPGSASQVWYCRSFWCWWGPVDSHFGMILYDIVIYADACKYIYVYIYIYNYNHSHIAAISPIEYGWIWVKLSCKELMYHTSPLEHILRQNRDISWAPRNKPPQQQSNSWTSIWLEPRPW